MADLIETSDNGITTLTLNRPRADRVLVPHSLRHRSTRRSCHGLEFRGDDRELRARPRPVALVHRLLHAG
jgi:hypothetical protein